MRGDLDLVGVSAWHREPPLDAFTPPVPVRQLLLPRRALYESWQLLRRPLVERATGLVDVVHDMGYVVPPSRAPLVATVHDSCFFPKSSGPLHVAFRRRAETGIRARATSRQTRDVSLASLDRRVSCRGHRAGAPAVGAVGDARTFPRER